MGPRVLVVDYGAGNLRSVARALAHAGSEPVVSGDPHLLATAEGVVLPGVGAAGDTMANLYARGLVEPLREFIDSGRPFFGVCMGLQALFEWSEEGGGQRCLGILAGKVRRFSAHRGLKVPHMGWNAVSWQFAHPVVEGIPSGSYFYFVHSFYPVPDDRRIVLGVTDYGGEFTSMVVWRNVVATQFHPEKSGVLGLRMYENFLAWVSCGVGEPGGVH